MVAGALWLAGAVLPGGGYSQIDNVAKDVAKPGWEILSRIGTSRESAGRLGRKAAEAEEKILTVFPLRRAHRLCPHRKRNEEP